MVDDGGKRTPEDAYILSSSSESNGSGVLKMPLYALCVYLT